MCIPLFTGDIIKLKSEDLVKIWQQMITNVNKIL